MRKSIRLLALAISAIGACGAALGQAPPPAAPDSAFSWGLKGGVNFANVLLAPDLPPGYSKSSRTGFIGGASAEARLSDTFSVQLEAFYTQKGFEVSSAAGKATYRLDYLELPLTAKATFGSGPLRPYLFAGPVVGFRLSATAESGSSSGDFKDSTRSTDLGVDLGAGLLYRLNPGTALVLEGRYSVGLVNIFNTGAAGGTVNTRDLKILAGVTFAIGASR
ncbi:MAG TPA: porin family protein [Thermoanaerobaculia bacterium]|nr:porin family protein [Thermoanaerobaculia bacterium]